MTELGSWTVIGGCLQANPLRESNWQLVIISVKE